MKKLIALTLIASHLTGTLTWAANAGGLNGGGVDVVVSPRHDQVVLADPYGIPISNLPASYKELFSAEIRAEVEKLITYTTELLGSKMGEHLRKLTTNGDIEFFVVKELPNFPECMRLVKYQGIQPDEEVARAACTVGKSTWIIDDLFRRLSTGPWRTKASDA